MSLALELRIDAERLRRAWWIHFLSSIGAVLGRFVIGVVLARLLAPRELGLFATASAIVGQSMLSSRMRSTVCGSVLSAPMTVSTSPGSRSSSRYQEHRSASPTSWAIGFVA